MPSAAPAAAITAPQQVALIEVLAFKPMQNTGNLRALASVRIGRVVVHDFRVVREEGKAAFVQAPIRTWIDKQTGTQKYGGPLVELPQETMDKISGVLLTRLDQHDRHTGLATTAAAITPSNGTWRGR